MSTKQDMERYLRILGESSNFGEFERDDLETLIGACEQKRLAPRGALWAVGSPCDAAYILIEGRIETTRRLPPDGQRVEQIDEPGSLLAVASLAREWEHESAASALERSELLKLDREAFGDLFDAGEAISYRLVDHLADELVAEMRDANRRLYEVFGNPAETLRTLRRRVRKA